MEKISRFLTIVLVGVAFAACAPLLPSAATTVPSDTPMPPSVTPAPDTPVPTDTPSSPSATPTHALETAQAKVSVAALNLRAGPGTTFDILARLTNDTQVTVLGKALGDQWVYADTGKQKGWLAVDFLSIAGKSQVEWLPVISPEKTTVIQGKVIDKSGQPIGLIGFALVQGTGQQEKRADATSLTDGKFYFYLPSTANGTWTFSLVSYDCRSPVMNANCKITGTFNPSYLQFNLPDIPDLTVTFSK